MDLEPEYTAADFARLKRVFTFQLYVHGVTKVQLRIYGDGLYDAV